MDDYLPAATREFCALAGPTSDGTQKAMEEYAETDGFPIIGPTVGGLLSALAGLTDANRVFEFGSGFGYSASWFARGMDGGEITLTEIDEDELELARDYLDGAGYAPTFRYVHGDALEAVEREEGPFDVVLIDHDKARYVEGFERIRDKIVPGGAILADNMMHGPVTFDDVLAGLEGESTADPDTAGVVGYLNRIRNDPDFHAVVLPIGSGVSVGVRRG